MKRLSLMMAVAAVCAQAIEIPRIGFARDAERRVTVVNGLAGNFVLGATMAEPSAAFSFNGSLGVRITQATVELWDASGAVVTTAETPAGDAPIVGLGGDAAWLFSKSVFRLRERLQPVPAALSNTEEEVLALTGGRDSTVVIAVRRSTGIFLATFDVGSGARVAEAALGRPASHVLLLEDGGGVVGIEGSTLWVQRTDGTQWSADVGAELGGLAWMGREWIHVAGRNSQFALRLRSSGDPKVYALPQAVGE